jgi:hypothetical protein
VAELGLAIAHRVEHLERGHELAGGEQLDLEPAVGHLAREVLRPASHHPPADAALGDRRGRDGGRGEGTGGALEERSPAVPDLAHLPFLPCRCLALLGIRPPECNQMVI